MAGAHRPQPHLPGVDLELPDGGTTAVAAANVVAPVAPVAPTAPVVAAAPLPVSSPTSTETPTPTPAGTETRRAGAPMDADAGDSHHRASSLPELAALGLGAIACAALARRSRRRRLLQQVASEPPMAGPLPSPGSVDADVLLQRFQTSRPALGALEQANFRLGHELGADRSSGPGFRAVCVTSFGVDFWLASPGAPPPDGFSLVEEGQAWHIPLAELDVVDLARPHLPVIPPIGDDDEGTWLVPVQPGTLPPSPRVGRAATLDGRAACAGVLDLVGPGAHHHGPGRGGASGTAGTRPADPVLRRPHSAGTRDPGRHQRGHLPPRPGHGPVGAGRRARRLDPSLGRDRAASLGHGRRGPAHRRTGRDGTDCCRREPTEADAGRTDAQEAHAPHVS